MTSPAAVEVLLPVGLDRALTYAVPAGLDVAPGALVLAPLGSRIEIGVAWDGAPADVDPAKLKPLHAVLDLPPMAEPMRRFLDRVAAYTLAPRGQVLRMALRGLAVGEEPRKPKTGVRATGAHPARMTPARERA
ncbi:primosomal protein N', partial [Methylopila musalis]